MMKLSDLKEMCIRAHNGTSFSPEKRGESIVKEYSQALDEDLEAFRKRGCSTETLEWYEAKFKTLFTAWMYRKQNCISSMITGASNFPTNRAKKANRSEDNAFQVFEAWRVRMYKRLGVERGPRGMDAELDEARKRLTYHTMYQNEAKEINKICKSKKLSKAEKEKALIDRGHSAGRAATFVTPHESYERPGVPAYRLTNNLATVKRLEEKVTLLESKIEKRETQSQEGISGKNVMPIKGGTIQMDYEADRITITHDEKPDRETLTLIKEHGFKWSPLNRRWQRKITNNAVYSARILFRKLAP